jgi:hypothetical protein
MSRAAHSKLSAPADVLAIESPILMLDRLRAPTVIVVPVRLDGRRTKRVLGNLMGDLLLPL